MLVCVIVDYGGALRYLSFRQLVGRGLAGWPMFEVDESAGRQTRLAAGGTTDPCPHPGLTGYVGYVVSTRR